MAIRAPLRVFGNQDCMSQVRGFDFDGVIGVWGVSAWPVSQRLDRKVNWVGRSPNRVQSPNVNERAPLLKFAEQGFGLLEDRGPQLFDVAPQLSRRGYGKRLTKSRFCGVPRFFPTDYVGNTVGDVMMAVDEPLGDGKVFREHLGESRKFADAYVADAAHVHADWLVSGDKRLRTRAAAIGSGIESMDYAGFRARLSQMS